MVIMPKVRTPLMLKDDNQATLLVFDSASWHDVKEANTLITFSQTWK